MKFIVLAEYFFFQAEDGIRDTSVTGVQTCALPILENCIARAVTLGDGKTIDVSDLPPAIRSEPAEPGSAGVPEASSLSTTALAEMERMTILRVFEQAHGDKALAGKMLGISRATLYRKLKRYN